jgi:SpoVK/Ycf46/Vps4 family AAA+-type ATPase
VAEGFFITVCEWASEVRGEVLVFDQGCWYKSEALYDAIRGASFENLILQGTLKEEIQADFDRFLASRETYDRYGIPWKRGVLLVGPPGNGKTHAVKALVNRLSLPCLYVKSFKSEYGTEHGNIHSVFERARQTTPCILVLEDLDSLVDDNNRSFFLNELDGFASNTGVMVLATTNHPERLDPSILDRPSRFDRKYHFELPGLEERVGYLRFWNETVQPELRLSENGTRVVAEATDGYSFAYLKELWLSSMMRWMNKPEPAGMDTVMAEQADLLREQMAYSMDQAVPAAAFVGGEGDED